MPNMRGSMKEAKKKKVKSKVVMAPTSSPTNKSVKTVDKTSEGEETAYKQLYKKVQEKRKITEQSKDKTNNELVAKKKKNLTEPCKTVGGVASFLEDDNYVDMEVSDINNVFPSEEEDEEDGEIVECSNSGQDNNASMAVRQDQSFLNASALSAAHHQGDQGHVKDAIPHCLRNDPEAREIEFNAMSVPNESDRNELKDTMSLIQKFMVQKGIISGTMSEDEVSQFILKEQSQGSLTPQKDQGQRPEVVKTAKVTGTGLNKQNAPVALVRTNNSEVTVYKPAVTIANESANIVDQNSQ